MTVFIPSIQRKEAKTESALLFLIFFTKFTRKHLYWSLVYNKVASLGTH